MRHDNRDLCREKFTLYTQLQLNISVCNLTENFILKIFYLDNHQNMITSINLNYLIVL